jgi:altronate dehydratase
VSGILDGRESLDDAADRLLAAVLLVCSGKSTATERLEHREFAIHRRNPTF